jgi:hypothetical protein
VIIATIADVAPGTTVHQQPIIHTIGYRKIYTGATQNKIPNKYGSVDKLLI